MIYQYFFEIIIFYISLPNEILPVRYSYSSKFIEYKEFKYIRIESHIKKDC